MRRMQEIILIFGALVWFTALLYIFSSQTSIEKSDDQRMLMNRANLKLNELEEQNKQLRDLLQGFSKTLLNGSSTKNAYDMSIDNLKNKLRDCILNNGCTNNQQSSDSVTKEHEELVRRVNNDLVEMRYSLEKQLTNLKKNSGNLETFVSELSTRFFTQLQAAQIDAEDLSSLDDEWRKNEAKELQDLVQARLRFLQNPKDCGKARQLVCNLNKGCGFGCQVHHLAYCFMVAYGTKRTLVVESKNWRYNPDGWEAVFQPLSEACKRGSSSATSWRGEEASKNVQTVFLPIVDGVVNPPPYLPLGIPEDLAPRLLRLHGNPSVWWVGQFMRYLMRPQSWLQEDLDKVMKESGFESPVIGLHVRRTDKVGSEAAYHSIDEYMKHAITWYDKLDLRLSKEKPGTKSIRRIYLASDDPSVLPEARKKYSQYTFYGDTKIADSAGLGRRYSKGSLRGVVMDIVMLSKCNFLVCTFSSQVCRVAYELMQTLHPDASSFFHSLDDIYYYGGQTGHEQMALYPHEGKGDEISMQVGDVVGIAGNHWDGYSKGKNRRTGKTGLYPSYKMEEIFRKVKYPTFSEGKVER